jgi:hypothetical protein
VLLVSFSLAGMWVARMEGYVLESIPMCAAC